MPLDARLDFPHRAFFVSRHSVLRHPLPIDFDEIGVDGVPFLFQVVDTSSETEAAKLMERLERRKHSASLEMLEDLLGLTEQIH
jgi:hypothetical protein